MYGTVMCVILNTVLRHCKLLPVNIYKHIVCLITVGILESERIRANFMYTYTTQLRFSAKNRPEGGQ
jgi:hypothetical protein